MLSFGKRLLTGLLSAAVILPNLAVPMAVSAGEVKGQEDQQDGFERIEDTSGSDVVGQYTLDEVASDLLVPHADKSSELVGSTGGADYINEYLNDEDFISLSCDPELYDSLGFNSEQMTKEVRAMAKDPANQNPMSGYTFADPNELLIGSVNRYTEHEGWFETWDNYEASSLEELPSYGNNTKSTEDLQLWEYSYNQTHNAVGIDIDGDGLDELAYYTLYSNNDEADGSLGSSCCVDIYKRVPDSSGNSNGDDPADVKYMWSKVHHFTTFMDEQTYVLNIPAAESKGYVSLAAGDYDGDGKEELAYYMPDKKGEDDSQDARVMVMKINEDNGVYSHRELGRIYLKDITSDYGKMGYVDAGIIKTDDYHLPTVALSTTSTRLGKVKNTSSGAKQYETHDDLVLTVSVPTMYHNRNLDLNSITTIYSFDGETVPDRIFREEYKPFNDNKNRMNYPNTCDADLNGDGFNEIVVAGIMEYDMNTPSGANDVNRNFGTLSNQKNYVNIISYTGSGYELLWSTPKEVDAPGNLSPQHYNSIEPTALCAGHFLCDTPAIKDQICIQGVILDCEGAKVSGAPVRTAQDGSGNNVAIITDTQPYLDKENFGSDVSFNKKYVL